MSVKINVHKTEKVDVQLMSSAKDEGDKCVLEKEIVSPMGHSH